ncbi:hypothetical protein PACTADRAFT_46955 [Pachysolen tannophilus NRRL Y-2460]|uniref:CRAL-TRIO domain-containing protein n=1 Tax=Pachysolen tannophilus NRRL Y-2460 TaxID=669874 RepID=A0A1E4TNK0_PACTA|nr:hypothetical protein PACTADRAFT_46955 [Pachysolen tannophilus NRRL Y-2460]
MFGFLSKEEIKPSVKKDLGPKIYEPFEKPLDGLKSTPRDPLTLDQEKQYLEVLNHFLNDELSLPVREKPEDSLELRKLTYDEKSWLTRDCILRYIRACNWKLSDAIKRLENSLIWRRDFGISGGEFQTLTEDVVAIENETGKQLIFGYDNGCRPCLFLRNGKQNTKASFRQIQHLIFMLESVIDFMPPGEDNLALCVDFKAYPEISIKGANMPSVSVGKQILHILQYHYPERLGRALFVNIPWYARIFLDICYPFVDPYTKQKISFDKPFSEFIPLAQLGVEYDGDANFEYVHEKYWAALNRIKDTKRKHYMDRFEKLGATIGLNELDLRSDAPIVDGKVIYKQ